MLDLTFSAQCNFFEQLTIESCFFYLGCQSSPQEGCEARAIDRAPHSELAPWICGICKDWWWLCWFVALFSMLCVYLCSGAEKNVMDKLPTEKVGTRPQM